MTSINFFILPVLIYTVPLVLGLFGVLRLMGQKFAVGLLFYSAVPICSWLILIHLNDKGKTMSNFVVEPAVLSLMVCILVAIHSAIENRIIFFGKALEVITTVFSFLIAVAVFLWMPALPE